MIQLTNATKNITYLIPIDSINWIQEGYKNDVRITNIMLKINVAGTEFLSVKESLSEIYDMIKEKTCEKIKNN